MLEKAGYQSPQFGAVLVETDKLDKIGRQKVEFNLYAQNIPAIPTGIFLDALQSVSLAKELISKHEVGLAAASQIDQILSLIVGTPAEGQIT